MGKVTGKIFVLLRLVTLHAFREASTFIRVDSDVHQVPGYFDNPGKRDDFLHLH